VENLAGFCLDVSGNGVSEPNAEGRMQYHPETQKLFLYDEDVDEITNEPGKKKKRLIELLNEHADVPFVALIGVKLRHQFFDEPSPCNPCICIETFLERYKREYNRKKGCMDDDKSAKFIALRSLSIYDVYVLVFAKDPNYIVSCVRQLQNATCDFSCGKECGKQCGEELTLINIATKSADKLTEKYKGLRKLLEAKYSDSELSKLDSQIAAIKADLKESMNNNTLPYSYKGITNLIEPLQKLRKTATSFTLQELILHCISAIRASGPMPVVLQTYSIMGVMGKHDPQEFSGKIKVLFNLQLQMHPGSGVEQIKDELKKYFTEESDELEEPEKQESREVSMVLGRYYYVIQGRISLKKLMELYDSDMLNWKKRRQSPIQYSNGRVLYEEKVNGEITQTAQDAIDMKRQLYEEDSSLALLWVEEQHEKAAEIFRKINTYEKKFPFLQPLIKAISQLHMQGCRRFFYALSWAEFEEARDFFDACFARLGDAFETIEQQKEDDQYNYAFMIYWSMVEFLDKILSLFLDRMVLDISIHENTRPGIYATGAYEKLLEKYGGWIEDLSHVLGRLESEESTDANKEDKLHFVLVPVEQNAIFSDILLHLVGKESKPLVIFSTTFKKMLEISDALPMFVHETGHYLGIVNRKDRIKTYLSMVAYYYSARVCRDLCNRGYVQIPTDIVRSNTIDLYLALYMFFVARLENTSNEKAVDLAGNYLDFTEYHCKLCFNDFLQEALGTPKDDAMRKLVSAFVNLYDVLGASPFLTPGGKIFDALSVDIMTEALIYCKVIIRECYADLLMIHMLKLDQAAFLNILLKGLRIRDEQANAAATQASDRNLERTIDAIRAMLGLMQIELIKKDQTQEELVSNMPDTVLKALQKAQDFDDNKDETLRIQEEKLYNTLKSFIENKYSEEANDLLIIWRTMLVPYMYKSGKKIKTEFENEEYIDRECLQKIRKCYTSSVKNNDMWGLVNFVIGDEGVACETAH
jgi:hypothetical protein